MFPSANPKANFPELEKKILDFWKQEKIFKKSVNKKDAPEYTFYDGPPFATGLPHYGHILAGVIKDVVPRYFTMKGYKVQRRFGWDCHGLPVENIIEKELEVTDKAAIEKMGIGAFNEACRNVVLRYATDWRNVVERTGRWVDMDYDYKTMDTPYMESVWWVFKQLWDKGYIYEGYKPMHICPRCVTPLSNFEVGLEYRDITDMSVTAKFQLENEDQTFILAWTTTPWTLPGNVALAVHPDIEYVKVQIENMDENMEKQFYAQKGDMFILAQEALPRVFGSSFEEYQSQGFLKIKETFFGKDLIGKTYIPLFAYFEEKKKESAFRVVGANFVTTTDGTGIVHIAPAFGEDDMNVGKQEKLPMISHVSMEGKFSDEVVDFSGESVKPKGDTGAMDKRIIQKLLQENKVFVSEPYRHSYPHCWRCDTPLLNYATRSWFVKVENLKEKLLKNNDQVHWVPENIKYGRFGKWLENARDWAISRNRYWGAPLPIWRDAEGKKEPVVIGSLEELYQKVPEKMVKVILVRHGESEKNVQKIFSSGVAQYPLTEKGQKEIQELSTTLQDMNIDQAFVSPVLRTKQTAEILLQGKNTPVNYDDRLKEIHFGEWEEKKYDDLRSSDREFQNYKKLSDQERYHYCLGKTGECQADVEKRVQDFVDSILPHYAGKTILIVSHKATHLMFRKILQNWSFEKTQAVWKEFHTTGHADTLYIDSSTQKEFDLHKHIVDDITFLDKDGTTVMKRIPEVLDCWFESGSMPYAQMHYPFENTSYVNSTFPANFIAEGQDQTRGWFYTLTVLATALFDKPAFQNVVVNGIVLAEDGKKMSKKLQNYPDPSLIFEKYGADAIRFYLMNSPAVEAQDVRFSEKAVDEVVKSVLLPFWNSYCFFVTYANIDGFEGEKHLNDTFEDKLDIWILSELQATIQKMTQRLDMYYLNPEPILGFLDNLTNWYIRRSRRRFWKSENDREKMQAYSTLYIVLRDLSKLLAPFIPFVTEEIYKNLTGELSVHLSSWPEMKKEWYERELNEEIAMVRNIVSLGLAARAKQKIKVRQPLALLEAAIPDAFSEKIKQYESIILEELNVKEIRFLQNTDSIATKKLKPIGKMMGQKFGNDTQTIIALAKEGKFQEINDGFIITGGQGKEWKLAFDEVEIVYEGKEGFDVQSGHGVVISLDMHITESLKQEGMARDLVRLIQDMRKEADYQVSDRIILDIQGLDQNTFDAFSAYIAEETLCESFSTIETPDLEREMEGVMVKIKKA